MNTYAKYISGPFLEGLFLATHGVPHGHLQQTLSAQFPEEVINVFAERTEVRICTGSQCKHGEPISQTSVL